MIMTVKNVREAALYREGTRERRGRGGRERDLPVILFGTM
jgi:hypothetical protein